MKRRFAVIMAALLIAAMAGCQQSGTSSTADSDTVQSSADSSVAESAESEISEAESSVVSEETSTESSEEKSDTSAAESSENKSKTESSKPKNEESSKKETSKAETSKTETSKPVESSNPEESSTPSKKTEESSTPSKKPEESSTPSSTPKQEVKATGITLDLSSLSLTSGSTQELNAYILWSNGTSSYNGITWSTSNNGVATVSSSGYVTAKSAGTATITASYGSYSKSCTVTVKAAQVSQPSQPSGGKGGTQTQPSQPSGGGNSGNDGSGNGGSSGQTSKPSGGNNGGGSSGNNGSNNGGSGSGGETSKPSGGNGGSSGGQTQSGGKIVKGNWGWVQYRTDLYWLPAAGVFKDEKGNEYSAVWNAAEHEKNAVYSRNGKYKFYLCPEAIPVLNEFAEKEGKHFTWESKEWADKKGYEYQYLDQQGCIDNLEHIREIRLMEHETDYSCSPAYILSSMYSYDWYDYFDQLKKDAPSHWEILMRLASKGAVSVVIYKNPDGDGVSVAIK